MYTHTSMHHKANTYPACCNDYLSWGSQNQINGCSSDQNGDCNSWCQNSCRGGECKLRGGHHKCHCYYWSQVHCWFIFIHGFSKDLWQYKYSCFLFEIATTSFFFFGINLFDHTLIIRQIRFVLECIEIIRLFLLSNKDKLMTFEQFLNLYPFSLHANTVNSCSLVSTLKLPSC